MRKGNIMESVLKIVFVSLVLIFNSFVFAGGSIKTNEEKEVVMDIVHVHGMVLKGKITDLGPKKLSFRLVNIEGTNRIDYKDIESIQTKYNYNINYKDEKISGKLVGIVNGDSIQVQSNGKTKVIKISDIDHFAMTVEDDPSVENYMHNKLAYLSGSFNIGLEFEDGANLKNQTEVDAKLLRKKGQHETFLRFYYAYETQETSTTPKTVTEDEMNLALGHRYFYDTNDFLYGFLVGEYDRPRGIDNRIIPSMGYGHHFKLGKNGWVRPTVGLAYVDTSYTDSDLYPDNSFTAVALGLSTEYQFYNVMLIKKLKVDGDIMYVPNFSDSNEDWITRAHLNLTAPVYGFLTMKLGLQWINDSTPDPSIGNNKTKTNLMFGVDF